MENLLARNWWIVAIQGVLAIIFGIIALVWPSVTVAVLVYLYGIYAIITGVLYLVTSFSGAWGQNGRGWQAFSGAVSIIAGVVVLVWPKISVLVLIYIMGFWAILMGIFAIVAGIQLRREIADEWLLIIGGIVLGILGILLFVWPAASATALVRLLGIFTVAAGIPLIGLALRLRSMGQPLGPGVA